MNWKLAIFDWDGTLVDSREAAYEAATRIFTHYGVPPPSYSAFLKETNSNYMVFYRRYGVPENVSRKELNKLWREFFFANNSPPLREHAKEMLQVCRSAGLKVAIVSGNIPEIIHVNSGILGIKDLIDHVHADAAGKSDELRSVMKHFSAAPHETFYIDDTFEGISAANAVGMTSIAVEGGFNAREHLLEAGPRHMLSSLSELRKIIHG